MLRHTGCRTTLSHSDGLHSQRNPVKSEHILFRIINGGFPLIFVTFLMAADEQVQSDHMKRLIVVNMYEFY